MGRLVRVLCGPFEDGAMLGLSTESVDSLVTGDFNKTGCIFFMSPMLFDKCRALGSHASFQRICLLW